MNKTATPSPILLYLEDDHALAGITSRAMQRHGYKVLSYHSVQALREALPTLDFSHVLLDLKVGNENSLQLIDAICAHRDVPVVILTGYGSIRTAVQAIRLGAVDFLSKPCHPDDIAVALSGRKVESSELAGYFEKPSLRSLEWEAIQRALDENKGNISATAKQLKMHRRTLQRKLQKRQLREN
ncbi:MAG: response regulator transcription factor [Parahaliea sp.]